LHCCAALAMVALKIVSTNAKIPGRIVFICFLRHWIRKAQQAN
jgi:hypothetical protein